MCKAGHGLDQGAETRLVRVRPGLPPAADPGDHQPWVEAVQYRNPQPHRLQLSRNKVLHEDITEGNQRLQLSQGFRIFEVQREAALVASVNLPPCFNALIPPVPQVVTPSWTLNFYHVSTEIGKLGGQDISSNQPRQIKDSDTLKWSFHKASKGFRYTNTGLLHA